MSDFEKLFLENQGFIEFLAICLTMITFAVGYAINVRKRRRTRALEFITQITITEPMVSESHNMYNLLLKFKGKKPTIEELNEAEMRTVMIVGSFYEFLGLSLLQKLLNRDVILLSRYAVMEQTWNTFETVIIARREALDRRFLFGSFEKAVKDFRSDYSKLQQI